MRGGLQSIINSVLSQLGDLVTEQQSCIWLDSVSWLKSTRRPMLRCYVWLDIDLFPSPLRSMNPLFVCIFVLFLGNPQAELLNRLIEGCLDSHYRLLVLQ